MNFSRFIYLSLVIFMITFGTLVLEFIALPMMARMGIKQIHPFIATSVIWTWTRTILLIVSVVLIFLYLVFYIIWKLIRRYAPKIFGIRKRLLRIPPLPVLDKAGIFRLYDAVFDSLFAWISNTEKAKRIGGSITNFFLNNKNLIQDAVKPIVGTVIKYDEPPKTSSNDEDETTNKKRPPKEDTLNDSEKKTLDDLYQQCLEEKIKPITSSMNNTDKQKINISNTNAKLLCKVKGLQHQINLLSFKM